MGTFPAWWRPQRTTAWAEGEADNHLWMHWQAAHPGRVWSNWPTGTGLSLVDPVNLPWFALGFGVSPAFAWNLAWFVLVGIALAGGLALGRAVTEREEGGWIGLAAVGASPFLHGVWAFGLTEDGALGWYALHLATLIWCGRGSWVAGVISVACLAAYASSGPYAALFAGIGAPFAVAWVGRRAAPVVGLGLLLAVPALLGVLDSDIVRRMPTETPAFDAGWRVAPQGGTDLLRLILPVPEAIPSGRSAYVGLVVLILAGLGAGRARAAALAAVVFAVVALGVELRVAGHRVAPMPLALVQPWLEGVHHWWRAVGPLQVWVAVLAASGAMRVAGARWPVALGLAALVTVDGLAFGGNPWPKEQYDPRPPSEIAAIPGEDALVIVPFDARGEFSKGAPRIYERWAPWLARPIAENYDGPDALGTNRVVAAADGACRGEPADLPDAAVDGAIAALHRAGGAHIVLIADRCADPAAATAVLDRLGPAASPGVWAVP